MVDIQCRTIKTHILPKNTGLDVECSLEHGLICKSAKGGRPCADFEIRVKCDCGGKDISCFSLIVRILNIVFDLGAEPFIPTTVAPPLSGPCDDTKPIQEHPSDCHLFYQCVPGMYGSELVEKTCGPDMMYNPQRMVCDFPSQVYLVRPECEEFEGIFQLETLLFSNLLFLLFVLEGGVPGRPRPPKTTRPPDESIIEAPGMLKLKYQHIFVIRLLIFQPMTVWLENNIVIVLYNASVCVSITHI